MLAKILPYLKRYAPAIAALVLKKRQERRAKKRTY